MSKFWALRGWEVGEREGGVNPLKKENSSQNSFFPIMLNEVVKSCNK